ncbi:MAG: contact-dependent growth inhibition system immunity protein [Geobacteraceae bacterium]|nr:contact-dependent growth inhibition system immunity protein [Geobacteraceae bacterium]
MKTTIETLEGKIWPEPELQSSLVLTGHALRKKPIDELTPNDLRVAFNEDIGAEFLKERVLELLENEPAIGDLFDGDLILAVMRSQQFSTDKEFRMKIIKNADKALTKELDLQTRYEIENLKTA